MNTIKAVILARVSSKSQEEEGYSLPAQEKLLGEYCKQQDFEVIKTFQMSESASKDKQRKVFKDMMKYISTNKIHILVCEKADRLTRNFKDMVEIDEWLNDNGDRVIHLVKDGLRLNRDSKSQEKLNWGMRVLIAKNYIDNLKEEVAKGMKEKLEQGWLPAVPPHGYTTTGDKGHKTHVVDWGTAPVIKKLFEEYLSPNHNIRTIADLAEGLGLRTRGGRPLVKSSIGELLSNEFYIGINVWNGMRYPGKQETFIEKSLFEEVQKKKRRKTQPKYRTHNPTYKNVFTCSECGGTITWEIQKGRWYGHCNGYKGCPKKPWAREDKVEERLVGVLDSLKCPSPALVEWIVDSLKDKYAQDVDTFDISRTKITQEINQKRRALGILYEDRLSERISGIQYDEKRSLIQQEIEQLELSSQGLDSSLEAIFDKGINILELSQKAAEMYPKMTSEEKRTVVSSVFKSLRLKGGDFEYELSPMASIVSKKVELHKNLIKKFEPVFDPSKKHLTEEVRSTWLGLWSDFRTL